MEKIASLTEIGREWAWRWRNAITWSPPVFHWPRTLPALLRTLPSVLRPVAEILAARYDLSTCAKVCDAQSFWESLYILDLLDRYAGPAVYPTPYLDIGCKNGCYLPGLQTWSGGPWDGVELDAQRRYWTLTTRRAHGEWIARSLHDCRYIAGDVLDLRGSYGFITWFLPFLHATPLRAWGLPRRFLMPARLLTHAWALLSADGSLLVVNQGEAEAEHQGRLFREADIPARALGRMESPLSPFQCPRFGWRADKP